ncbi:uncharacterized protein [Medicago truncatula]|uniref:uncharacterized protein n=1 Tax=Medicago truncatula TaxID=3880 RepID=UPI000D2F2575|nr:uncharacterized protein LOC112417266 [Medicago truncatula]
MAKKLFYHTLVTLILGALLLPELSAKTSIKDQKEQKWQKLLRHGEQFQRVGKTGQEYFAMASRNSARQKKAVLSDQSYVAETHWQRKLKSPWRAKLRQAKCHFFSICIKAHFPHFRQNHHNISHFRKRENRGNIERPLRSKGHKD